MTPLLSGGAIAATWGFAVGWAVETTLCAAGLVIAWAKIEPPTRPVHLDLKSQPEECSPSRQKGSARGWCIAVLILPTALLAGPASGASFLAQTSETSRPDRSLRSSPRSRWRKRRGRVSRRGFDVRAWPVTWHARRRRWRWPADGIGAAGPDGLVIWDC